MTKKCLVHVKISLLCLRILDFECILLQAWYRRGKANATLGNYEDAVRDLNVAMITELSVGGKRQIESELKLILDQHKEIDSCSDKANKKYLHFLGMTSTYFNHLLLIYDFIDDQSLAKLSIFLRSFL